MNTCPKRINRWPEHYAVYCAVLGASTTRDTCDRCFAQKLEGKHLVVPMKKPLRGLGDVVAAVTSAVGIKPCGGCKKRQATLNKIMPFKSHA